MIFRSRNEVYAYFAAYSDLRSRRLCGFCPVHKAGGHIYIRGARYITDGNPRVGYRAAIGA